MGGDRRASQGGWLVLKVWPLVSYDPRPAVCHIPPPTVLQAKVAGLVVLMRETGTENVKCTAPTPMADTWFPQSQALRMGDEEVYSQSSNSEAECHWWLSYLYKAGRAREEGSGF